MEYFSVEKIFHNFVPDNFKKKKKKRKILSGCNNRSNKSKTRVKFPSNDDEESRWESRWHRRSNRTVDIEYRVSKAGYSPAEKNVNIPMQICLEVTRLASAARCRGDVESWQNGHVLVYARAITFVRRSLGDAQHRHRSSKRGPETFLFWRGLSTDKFVFYTRFYTSRESVLSVHVMFHDIEIFT